VNKGEVHAIMGPNGSGKSTLSHVIAGKPGYEVTGGEILFRAKTCWRWRRTNAPPRACSWRSSIRSKSRRRHHEFPAHRAERAAQGARRERILDAGLSEEGREVAKSLNIPQDMLKRGVNVGFSGGEKKRNEILQMALFEPSLCILDEMDSGLDIDALRVAADGVNALRSPDRAMVVITHYQRLLNYIVPDFVHVMSKGRVVKSGGKELALELEASGYAQFEDAA
jgi:Fe-S cluster assembly ATP-binding protein